MYTLAPCLEGTSPPYQARAILCDLDNTLYDRQATFARWARAFVCSYERFQGDFQQEAIDFLIALDGDGHVPRRELFTAFQEQYPHLYIVDSIIEAYYQQFPAYIQSDHLIQLLQFLQCTRIPFGIVTNGFARQQLPKIAALGLVSLTSCVFISELFGVEKPDASIFLAAATSLGVPARQILFAGDNPLADIYGAHQVGMRTIWVRNGAQWPASVPSSCVNVIVNSLSELPAQVIAAIEAR